MDSILNDVKTYIGIPSESLDFNDTLIGIINSAISETCISGIPGEGYVITDAEDTWIDLVPENLDKLQNIPMLIKLKSKLYFDPPVSTVISGVIESQITKNEWLLSVALDRLEALGGEENEQTE